jgi:hypothetical protein
VTSANGGAVLFAVEGAGRERRAAGAHCAIGSGYQAAMTDIGGDAADRAAVERLIARWRRMVALHHAQNDTGRMQ